jgi:hypothetical protein
MLTKVEFIFLTIIIIGISAFIGLNIIRVVEKKMSNMKVNVPNINVPESKIYVTLNDKKGNCNVSCVQQVDDTKNKQQLINEGSSNKSISEEPLKKKINKSISEDPLNKGFVKSISMPIESDVTITDSDFTLDSYSETKKITKPKLESKTKKVMRKINKLLKNHKEYKDEDDVLTDTISEVYNDFNTIKKPDFLELKAYNDINYV